MNNFLHKYFFTQQVYPLNIGQFRSLPSLAPSQSPLSFSFAGLRLDLSPINPSNLPYPQLMKIVCKSICCKQISNLEQLYVAKPLMALFRSARLSLYYSTKPPMHKIKHNFI